MASPLPAATHDPMSRFFPRELLDNVRILELIDQRIEDPDFFAEARALGFDQLPELRHITSMTFLDVIVFNEPASQRSLFHGLVHAAQVHVLGVDWYSELFVRGFVEHGVHFAVSLEAQAFQLESRFMATPDASFPVVEIVREAALKGRY